jgi:hypothetical protein
MAAASKLKLETIECEVHKGELRDAILHSCGVNAGHGLRRSTEDKRRAVRRMLDNEEWSHWTDSEIARRCKVGHDLVARLRAQLKPVILAETQVSTRTFTHPKTGEPTQMRIGNIGRQPKLAASDTEPTSPAVPAAKPVGPEPMESENDAQDLVPVAKTNAPPPVASTDPASPPDPWADQRVAVRGSVRGLANLRDVDFGPVAATMSLEQLREARNEVDEAMDVAFAWSAALDAAIERATPTQEEMPPSPVAESRWT